MKNINEVRIVITNLRMRCLMLLLFIAVIIGGCLRLDSNLYNKKSIVSYQRDYYTGETDFTLDDSYKIQDTLITLFPLQSQAAGESQSTKIYATYIGDATKIKTD